MSKITLNPSLEKALVSAILGGTLPPEVVKPEELSKPGRFVLAAARSLLDQGVIPPLAANSIFLTATEVAGGLPTEVQQYLMGVAEAALKHPSEILSLVRHKQALVELINEAGRQLAEVDFDTGIFSTILGTNTNSSLESLSEALGESVPTIPV